MAFRTLLRNGAIATPLSSITSALLSMQWGVGLFSEVRPTLPDPLTPTLVPVSVPCSRESWPPSLSVGCELGAVSSPKFFRMRSSAIPCSKSFRMRSYKKIGGGDPSLVVPPMFPFTRKGSSVAAAQSNARRSARPHDPMEEIAKPPRTHQRSGGLQPGRVFRFSVSVFHLLPSPGY